jgi:16S rRNA (adenine1518-N6/adenine1519-N6)-dimethyltransferase
LLREEDGSSVPPYKVVANIPYYITSALLRQLLEASARPKLIVLMVQKEVARRIVAAPGEMSLLAVSVQFYASPRLLSTVPACAFYPVPKVSSAILRIEPHAHLPLSDEDIPRFFRIVRAGFGQRRKQLRNALRHGLSETAGHIGQALHAAGIDERRRAQSLDIDEWLALHRALEKETQG